MDDDRLGARGRARSWGALGALVVLGAIAGLAVASSSPAVYTASAESYLSTRATGVLLDVGEGDVLARQAEQSYASLARTPRVLDAVIGALDLHTTPDLLAKQVVVDAPADTVVLRISASDPSAQRSAAIVGAVQTALAKEVAAVTPSKASTKLTSISRAEVPAAPFSPNVPLDVVLGALGGAAIWAIVRVVQAIRRLRPPPSGGTAAPSML